MPEQFEEGDIVSMRQGGTVQVGGITLTDNVFSTVRIVKANGDGTYQVDLRAAIKAPGMNSVEVPGDWLSPS